MTTKHTDYTLNEQVDLSSHSDQRLNQLRATKHIHRT